MSQTSPTLLRWQAANRHIIAKSLAELCYEQVLTPGGDSETPDHIHLTNGIRYRFRAHRTIWDWLHIDATSIRREDGQRLTPANDAAQFFIDAAVDLQLDPSTLGNLLHETANTIAADVILLAAREGLDAATLSRQSDETLQCLLDGHPKAIANKGRIGWGAEEYARYGTESASTVRLQWLAVDRELAISGQQADWPVDALLNESLDQTQRAAFDAACEAQGVNWNDKLPVPVHPWQWQHHIRHHYAGEIAAGRIRPLGEFGDRYLPQVSLRTLSNDERPAALHIKLPLTVLNTSCYRGIPGQYMECGPALSAWVQALCETDTELANRGTAVLQEVAGVHVPHPHHSQIEGTPYRYNEMLGSTWRQSPAAHCAAGERHLLMAALLQSDAEGNSICKALIAQSGLSTEAWLKNLFNAVVIPLYHLLCCYGIGLVAHSQNLTLVLRDNVPTRVLLKDFQGDLRLVDAAFPEAADLPDSARAVLTRLPAPYIYHDLFTGHFVTVLRYLSAQLLADSELDELRFYRVLATVLRNYQATHPELEERFALFDLFREKVERVCINRVRFKVGYNDNAERPVPIVGGKLNNPLWLAEQVAQPLEQAS